MKVKDFDYTKQIYKAKKSCKYSHKILDVNLLSPQLSQSKVQAFVKGTVSLLTFQLQDNMNTTQIQDFYNFLQLNKIISPDGLNRDILWQNFSDEDLQRYENHLNSLSQQIDTLEKVKSLEYSDTYTPHLQMLRFKDLFLDFLEGQNHQILYIGFSESQEVQEEIIKLIASILFRIGQEEKTAYPHLLTHIKEQFYKPNIFQNQNLTSEQKENYSILIDIFFKEAHQTSKYEDFIQLNPDFQDICVIVFMKIALEDSKRTEASNLQQLNQTKTKAFQMIQIFCAKFLIEINYFRYEQPQIEMIALANQERFVFLNESNHLFLLTLQKFELLNVRRKSSHNISVHDKSLRKSSHGKNPKKNSWNELEGTAHFRNEEVSQKIRDSLILNIIDSECTSNYESSILKSESKVNQISDQSTPKFKNSSIAHVRKKSHKDSFGCVDFDNMVYKDLANPKRYAQQKAHREKDKAKNNQLNVQIFKKKVLSERFETHELQSLTYADDEESSIQFVPHFHTNEVNEKVKTNSIFGNNASSPVYSQNFSNFPHFVTKHESESKSRMIQRMKGSNIEKTSQFFADEEQLPEMIPQFKHQNSLPIHGRSQRTHSPGSRVLASSQIIEFTGSFFKQQNSHLKDQQNSDFLIIPSTNSKFKTISQKDENDSASLFVSPHKDVFLSFSKNDKQKFLIPDSHLTQGSQNQIKSPVKAQIGTQETLDQNVDEINNVRTRKYSYRTQKEERQKFRSKQKNQQDIEISQTANSFISQHVHNSFAKKPKYKKYQNINTSDSRIFNQFDSASQMNMKKSHTFVNQTEPKDALKLQRKHSSNIPVYKATQIQENLQNSRYPEVKLNQRNTVKRFEEHSVRFSQIFQNNEEEIFYVNLKDQNRESFGNRKQRKVTDFYESPLNLTKNGNRTSQIIQNVNTTQKHQSAQNRFEAHLNLSHKNSNNLINSGVGKNYSVISNISYDEEKRIQDLLQIENQVKMAKNTYNLDRKQNGNFSDQQIDFANIQAIEKLILKKKQQKIKLNSEILNVSVKSSFNHSEPKDWIKKEIFYFFEPKPTLPLQPPQKYVIVNPERSTKKVVKESVDRSNPKNKDIPSSSTSLYNFSMQRNDNPQSSVQKDKSVSNKSLGDRKYSVKEIRTVSEVNFNPPGQTNIHKLNSSPYMNNHIPNRILANQDKKTLQKDFDKASIYTQPVPISTIRISPAKKLQPVTKVIPAQSSLKISAQNLKTYPSQPIIRFTLGNNPQPRYIQPNPPIVPLTTIQSHQNIKTYRIG